MGIVEHTTPISDEDDELLLEIARQGTREHILYELASRGNHEMPAEAIAREELDDDYESYTTTEIAKTVINAIENGWKSGFGYPDEHLEEKHGDRADMIMNSI